MGSKLLPGYFALLVVAATLYGVSSVHVEIEPRSSIVFPNGNISILCRTGVPITYCRITLPGFGPALNLSPKSRYNREYNYFGTGLNNGQCGVTLPTVTDKFNGQVMCGVGTEDDTAESTANMTLTVAKSPSTPEMDVSPSATRSNEYREGEVVRATCIVKDGRPAANITWYMGDDVIREGLTRPVDLDDARTGLHTVVQNLTRSLSWRDNGKMLRCVAGHMAYGLKRNHTTKQVLVRYPPRDVPMPIEQFGFVIGQTGEVVVEITANPQPQFTWIIGNIRIQEGDRDAAQKYEASQAEFLGSGKWKAILFINQVTMDDVEKEYYLKAKNQEGEKTYRVVISTSSQPESFLLGIGPIIGIVMGILVLLLIIVIIVFARATGRWCFAGGVPPPRDPRESSDTESAEHHAAVAGGAEKKGKPKGKAYLTYFFKKKNDKVSADPEDVKTLPADDDKESSKEDAECLVLEQGKKDVVYAELDLQSNRGHPVVSVRADDDKTEYAEIIHTKADEKQ